MKRRRKIAVFTLGGGSIGAVLGLVALVSPTRFLTFLAMPALHAGPFLAQTFRAGKNGMGMTICLLTIVLYFAALGSILGFLISIGTTDRKA